MADHPLLELRDGHVSYGKGSSSVFALQGVDLTLNEGECLGIAGESGCGKSTLSHLLAGLLPERSSVSHHLFNIAGKTAPPMGTSDWKSLRGAMISMIFQDPIGTLNPFWTIGQQLSETLKFHKMISNQPNSYGLAETWLEKVQIKEPESVLQKYPHQLSGGMCQRVNLALALCTQPRILIADEPTTALDVTTQKTVLDLIANLSHETGMAVLLVSHDLGVLRERSDRLMVMYSGKTMETGPTPDLISTPGHPYTQALLKAQPPLTGPLPDKLEIIEGQPPQLIKQHSLCPFIDRCKASLEPCHSIMPEAKKRSNQISFCHREMD